MLELIDNCEFCIKGADSFEFELIKRNKFDSATFMFEKICFNVHIR